MLRVVILHTVIRYSNINLIVNNGEQGTWDTTRGHSKVNLNNSVKNALDAHCRARSREFSNQSIIQYSSNLFEINVCQTRRASKEVSGMHASPRARNF